MAGEIGMEAVDVRLGVACHRQDRRFHLQHIALGEEAAHQRIERGALLQRAQQGLAHRMPSGRGWSSGRVSRSRVSSM
jgi:hypothetical protein